MKEGRKVYSYRTWRRFFRALFWSTLGPLMAVGSIINIFEPRPTAPHLIPAIIIRWLYVIVFPLWTLSELHKTLEFVFERIVTRDTTLTFYNWLGLKKMSVELTDVTSVALRRGPCWEVETPTG